MSQVMERLAAGGFLSPLDVHFARAVGRVGGDSRPNVVLAAALASQRVTHGHVCLHLARLAREPMPADEEGTPIEGVTWPALAGWLDELRSSPLVATTEQEPVPPRPLVVDHAARVYLRRYWDYERQVATAVEARASEAGVRVDDRVLKDGLTRLFRPGEERAGDGPDWQRIAAAVAVRRRFTVISGGPGTGKTHTVVKILALLIEQALAAGRRPPRMHLVAPTGKAAARLAESVRRETRRLESAGEVLREIPAEASTIHRCIGASLTSDTRFRHHADNPLPTDLVLVDEASMVDAALMARLVAALPARARLILLGDKDQLASVEAGAVLGDICNTGAPAAERRPSRAFVDEIARITGDRIPLAVPSMKPGLGDCIVELQRSYRYGAESGIGRLAAAIKEGRTEEALGVLLANDSPDVALLEPPPPGELGERLRAGVLGGYAAFLKPAIDVEARLAAFDGFRVLSAHRGGPHGVERLNRLIEEALAGRDGSGRGPPTTAAGRSW